MIFSDRSDAGRLLSKELARFESQHPVVLGLPRGGVPVAYEAARALGSPLDVIVVRKLGVPYQPELAMGSIGEGGVRIINQDVVKAAGIDPQQLAQVEERERAELDRRAHLLRGGTPPVDLTGATAIVVDDGVATGSTARAACQVARARGAVQLVMAAPVASEAAVIALRLDADEVVVLQAPSSFWAVGQWYGNFDQTSDEVVVDLLERQRSSRSAGPTA